MKSSLEFYVVKLVPNSEYLADVLLLFEAEMAGSQVYIFCICLIWVATSGLYDLASLSKSKSIRF